MRKRINYRFALYLLLTLAALATGTHFLHAYQVQRNASSLLDLANHSREHGDLSKTADYLGQYVGLNPKDIDALAQYGLLLADDQLATTPQSKARALLTLERVLVRDPARHDVRRRAAKVAMSLGLYAAARDNVRFLDDALPNDPDVVQMLAQCWDALNDARQARRAYGRAIKISPHDLDSYARLAAVLRRHTADVLEEKETVADVQNRAKDVIDEMVEANRDSFRAYLLRAAYRQTFDGTDARSLALTAADVAQAEKRAPEAADVLLMAADLALAQGRVAEAAADLAAAQGRAAEARAKLNDCCKLHPQDWRSYQALARLEAKAGKANEAIACLALGLNQVPNRTELLWDRAKLLAAAGRGAEAEQSIDLLRTAGFPAADLDVLRGRVMMNADRWVDATKLLEEAYDALVTRVDRLKDETSKPWAEQAGLWLGECYEQVGNVGRAHTVYSRVVARNSQSIPGRIGVATTRCAQGQFQDALDQYRVLMRLPGAPAGARIDVARLIMLLNLEREAARRNWDEVDDAVRQAELLRPLPPSAAILRAEYLANQGKFDDAQKSLEGCYPDLSSRPPEIWVTLAALHVWQGHLKDAQKCLNDALRIADDTVELRLARARLIVRLGEGQTRDALLALADDVDDFSVADRRRLFQGLASAYARAKLTAEANDLWQRLAGELPGDLQCRLALFDLAALAGDEPAMQRWQKEIRGIEGDDGVMWRNCRISALLVAAQRGNLSGLDEARALLAEMAARRPDWPRVPLAGARINDAEKRPDDALPLYLRAIHLGARDPAALVRTYNLLVERGRVDDANHVARLLPNAASSTDDNRRAIGEVALRANDLERARQLAEGVVAAAPDDYRGLLLRGQTHWAAGRPAAAEVDYRKARERAPSNPTTWLTLVQFLVETQRMPEAVAEADAAQGVLTGPKGLSALARINSLVGRADKAADLFRAAVAAAGDDAEVLGDAAIHYLQSGRQKEAEDLLRRLSQSADSKWAAQARYLRAALLAGRGSPDALKEALALIESPGVDPAGLSGAEKVHQLRSRAQLLAMQPFRKMRREAAQILEDLIDRQLATPADHLLTAQLYESIEDVAKARVRYAGVLTVPGGDNPAILSAAGRFLVRHGDLAGAAQALRGLEGQPRQAAAAKVLRARLLHAQDQIAKAVALLLESAEGPDRLAVAGVLEEMGQYGEAEAQLRKFVAAPPRPEDALALVHYLMRRKRYVEALEQCDGAWQRCPPAMIVETCLVALSEMPPDPSAVGRVRARVETALAKAPEDPALVLALAVLHNFQNRFDDAESLYRRILAKDPGHATALNNLAWLLALKGGHADEAVGLVNRAVQLIGPNPHLLDTRAVAYLALNRSDAADFATKDLDEVIAESPSSTAYFHLAQAHLLAGRKREALQAWRKANQGTPLKPESLHPLERAALDRLVGVLGPPT